MADEKVKEYSASKKLSHSEIFAKKIRNQQPVAESQIWGNTASDLIQKGLVDKKQIDAYRIANVMQVKKVHNKKAHKNLHEKYGDVVDEYFSDTINIDGGSLC